MSDPAQLRQLMESPMVQSITSNPDLLRSLLLSNPQMRDLMEVISTIRFIFFYENIFSVILKYPIYLIILIYFGKQWNMLVIQQHYKNLCVIMIEL
jgi:hypothetical protein